MVKNTTGGSKHKGLARKLVNAPVNDKLRLPQDDCECFAKVVKMLGNGMCYVNLVYKNSLFENVICHIRGKFKNRNKRSNLVSFADTLLVGVRDWESNILNCDLLFIYNEIHLKSLPLPSFGLQFSDSGSSDFIQFSTSHNITTNHIDNLTPHNNHIHDSYDIPVDVDLI